MRGRVLAFAAAALCVGVCGTTSAARAAAPLPIADTPPADVVAAVIAAASNARSVHVTGGGALSLGGRDVQYDLRLAHDSGYGRLAMTDGGTIEAVRIGGIAYIRGDRAFWREQLHHDPSFRVDQWAEASVTNPVGARMSRLLDIPSALAFVLPKHARLVDAGRTVYDGAPAIQFTGTGDDNAELYVAASGPPYPLLYSNSVGQESSVTLTFSDWNAPLKVKAPKASYTLDGPDDPAPAHGAITALCGLLGRLLLGGGLLASGGIALTNYRGEGAVAARVLDRWGRESLSNLRGFQVVGGVVMIAIGVALVVQASTR